MQKVIGNNDLMYWIVQTIDNEVHYYQYFERLHPTSQAWGIVWNEYACFGNRFLDRSAAKYFKGLIERFDPSIKCKVVSVNNSLIKKSKEIVVNLKS